MLKVLEKMNYDAVIEQVKSVPEEYLDDISRYINNVVNMHSCKNKKSGLREFYGALHIDGDPLEIQKQMRNEWD